MKTATILKGVMGMLLLFSALACNKNSAKLSQPLTSRNKNTVVQRTLGQSSVYWTSASQTHNFVYGNILLSNGGYRENTTTNSGKAGEWYNASQIYADAVSFINQGGPAYQTYINNDYTFMNTYFLDNTSTLTGGYRSESNTASTIPTSDKFVDDNSLTGVAFLDWYAATGDTRFLTSAQNIANWLMNCGLWDNNFGGGFWQSTAKLVKPTQSNGLAMQFFLKLYNVDKTKTYYLSWANSIRTWIEGNLYDNGSGCYYWQFDANGTKETRLETYTNAIMIEADLLYASITTTSAYNGKAQALGSAMNTSLWHASGAITGVYAFSNQTGNVNPAWCVWGSQAMMLLYQFDHNTAWLDYAQQNIDWINTHCRNSANYGYYQYVQLDGTSPTIDYEGVDQAWMQREQVLLSNYK
jgi:hypothetical protein